MRQSPDPSLGSHFKSGALALRIVTQMASGPLKGVKILEFAGLGPAPFCGMLLSDMGADVVRVDRKAGARALPNDILARGRRSIGLDLKDESDKRVALALLEKADALIE